jgi:DNA-binding Xre family transcriptional regulator
MRGEIKMKNPYGTNGIIDFSRLWELLERRGHNKAWLRANGIHANTIVKLRKNENVTCEVLANLCHLLDCQVWEILEYKKTENTRK